MSEKITELKVVKLTQRGLVRVLDSRVGMTFIVDAFTQRADFIDGGLVYHVRDYRYESDAWGAFCIWSLAPGDYEEVKL